MALTSCAWGPACPRAGPGVWSDSPPTESMESEPRWPPPRTGWTPREAQRQPVGLLHGGGSAGRRASHGREAELQLRDTGRPQPRAGATDTAAAGCTGHGTAGPKGKGSRAGVFLVTPEEAAGGSDSMSGPGRNHPCEHGSGAEEEGATWLDPAGQRAPGLTLRGEGLGLTAEEMATVPGGAGTGWVLAEAAVPGGGRGPPRPRHVGVSAGTGQAEAHCGGDSVHTQCPWRHPGAPALTAGGSDEALAWPKLKVSQTKAPDSTSERAQQGGKLAQASHPAPRRRRRIQPS